MSKEKTPRKRVSFNNPPAFYTFRCLVSIKELYSTTLALGYTVKVDPSGSYTVFCQNSRVAVFTLDQAHLEFKTPTGISPEFQTLSVALEASRPRLGIKVTRGQTSIPIPVSLFNTFEDWLVATLWTHGYEATPTGENMGNDMAWKVKIVNGRGLSAVNHGTKIHHYKGERSKQGQLCNLSGKGSLRARIVGVILDGFNIHCIDNLDM